jgi:saccharopine dehydrogenase (NAD+, L-lysine forming)
MPRWIKATRVTFKYGLGAEFIDVLKTLHKLGLDKTELVNVKGRPGLPARRCGCLPSGPGIPRRRHARRNVRRLMGHRNRQGRKGA